jgi:multicomponent Na+:H+ antiporter subunit G
MSLRQLAVIALLVVGVGVTLLSCLGVLVMRDAYDRLHYTTPAAVLAPVAIAAAVVVEERLSAAGVKAVLVALVLVVTNPVLGHATARAARIRRFGEWTVQAEEREGEQRS